MAQVGQLIHDLDRLRERIQLLPQSTERDEAAQSLDSASVSLYVLHLSWMDTKIAGKGASGATDRDFSEIGG